MEMMQHARTRFEDEPTALGHSPLEWYAAVARSAAWEQ
jgi:hypothetical protein